MMDETVYDGIAIEDVIVSHPMHEEYNSVRWWYRGEEINPKDVEVVIYDDKERDE